MTYQQRVRHAAERINSSHGYGDISECRVFLDGRVELVIRRRHMHDTTRQGHIANGRLFYARTSRKIA